MHAFSLPPLVILRCLVPTAAQVASFASRRHSMRSLSSLTTNSSLNYFAFSNSVSREIALEFRSSLRSVRLCEGARAAHTRQRCDDELYYCASAWRRGGSVGLRCKWNDLQRIAEAPERKVLSFLRPPRLLGTIVNGN